MQFYIYLGAYVYQREQGCAQCIGWLLPKPLSACLMSDTHVLDATSPFGRVVSQIAVAAPLRRVVGVWGRHRVHRAHTFATAGLPKFA